MPGRTTAAVEASKEPWDAATVAPAETATPVTQANGLAARPVRVSHFSKITAGLAATCGPELAAQATDGTCRPCTSTRAAACRLTGRAQALARPTKRADTARPAAITAGNAYAAVAEPQDGPLKAAEPPAEQSSEVVDAAYSVA